MERDSIKTLSQIMLYIRRVHWAIALPLLLLVLAGCLTSHAAGPPEAETTLPPTATVPLPSPTVTASPTTMPGVTVVANAAIRVFQTVTPTVTATNTPTITPIPETTATPTPTATATPTVSVTPPSTATQTPIPTNTPVPTRVPVTQEPFQAYAWMDNYLPAPGSVVTVYGKVARFGRPIEGANMGATFRFTNGQDYCSAYTNIQGLAACSINVGRRLQGYWAFVDVVFVFADVEVYAKTAFLVDP